MLWGADKLEAELAAAKDDLRGLEKNIRKILGRDAPDGENGLAQQNNRIPAKRPIQEEGRRRPTGQNFQNNGFPPKRRFQQGTGNNNNAEPKTVFSRLSARAPVADDSGDEDDSGFKPAVSSRVIATPREMPTRQDVLRRESTDERSKQRNRRMFGALLGTLQKFRQEETKLKAKEDKKAEIEARVEEAKRKEKEELKKERQQLFLTRKQQLAQVKALEAKVARSKQYQDWRAAQIPLLNFIKTKTEPHIYYLPKISTPETDTLLQESSKELKAEIDRREKELLDDLEIIQYNDEASRKTDKNISISDGQDRSMMEEDQEDEIRDVIPETNGDFDMIEPNELTETHEMNHTTEMNETNETTNPTMDTVAKFDSNKDTKSDESPEHDTKADVEVNLDSDIVMNPEDETNRFNNDEELKQKGELEYQKSDVKSEIEEHAIEEIEEHCVSTQEEDKENMVSTQEKENEE